jgi:uncharacterized protein (DUF2141 family)
MIRACCAALMMMLVADGARGAEAGGQLTVTVEGVRDARGHVRVGVCTRAQFLTERCSYHAVVPSTAGRVTVTIGGIVPGVYAVAAYQDATDAGHLRRGLFGIPRDGTGFSRNPSLLLGPPGFNASAITVAAGAQTVRVMLHYF